MEPNLIAILALAVSIIAIFFTALKDFILPWYNKPVLEIIYAKKSPFVRIVKEKTFHRFRIRNIGHSLANQCRCQIISVTKDGQFYKDFTGFPLNWAGRPEYILDPVKAERLSIGQGEMEYIDVVLAVENQSKLYFLKYHNEGIGIDNEIIGYGNYSIKLLFSGDNFKPITITFDLEFIQNAKPKETVKISELKYK